MQAAVFRWVAMRFVTGVDNRTLECGFEAHFLFKEVCSLAELIGDVTWHRAGRLTPHLASPGEHLTSYKVRRNLRNEAAKRHGSINQKVFVTSIAVAFAVTVVFVNDDFAPIAEHGFGPFHAEAHDFFSGSVIQHGFDRGATLGG